MNIVRYRKRGETRGGELVAQVSYSVFSLRNMSGEVETIDASDPNIEQFDCSSYTNATVEQVLHFRFGGLAHE